MLAEPVMDVRRVKIECPACGKGQYVRLRAENLETRNGVVSLVIKAACDHEFNLYLDKQFQVRGYERIDAVVSAEMLQVDQEISDFMKGEGIKERASGRFVGKLRNDLDRDLHLATIIRYFRGADVTDAYWIAAIGGRRAEQPKFDPAKAFPLPPVASFPAPPVAAPAVVAAPAPALPSPPVAVSEPVPAPALPSSPVAVSEPVPAPALPSSPVAVPASKAKPVLKGLPSPKKKAPAAPAPEPVAVQEEPVKVAPKPEPAIEPEVVSKPEVPVAVRAKEAEPEAEAIATPEPAEATDVPEVTMEDLRAQFEARIKKINDLMIKLELDNLNETVSDVALVKKKAKLSKIKDDLEAQFNKIVTERGLDKAVNTKTAASLA